MSSSSQQSTLESIISPDSINKPITAEAVATIIHDAIRTNDSFIATLSRPQLVALSDQTKIQEHSTKDMEINDSNFETHDVTIKEEDKDNSESALTPKCISPCLPLNQLNSLEWFQEWFNMPKPYSQAQSTLEEKNSMVFQLLTSQHATMDLKICLIDLLYGVIAEFNCQQTIVNLYWNYLLQEAKTFIYPTTTLPLTSNSLTKLPRSITNYTRFDIDSLTRQRLAVLWRLLSYPSLTAALIHGAQEVYNYQATNLIQIFGNHISLRWQDETALHIRGNIDQMTLDIL